MSSTTPQHLVSAAAETLATLTSSNSGPNDGSCGASLLPSNTSSSNFSAVSDHTYASSIEDSQKVAALSRGTTISNTQSFFPLKLHEIISDERNFDIIQWLPSGKAFIIVDKKRFAKEILPRFFTQQCKFTSFTRKLTRWRFNRVPRGPLIGAYYHELFLRDQKNLCYQMDCKSDSKSSKGVSTMKQLRHHQPNNASQLAFALREEHASSLTNQRPPCAMLPTDVERNSLPPLEPLQVPNFVSLRNQPQQQSYNNSLASMPYPTQQLQQQSQLFMQQGNPHNSSFLLNALAANNEQHAKQLQAQQASLAGTRAQLGSEILAIEQNIRKLEEVQKHQKEKEAALLQAYCMLTNRRAATNSNSFSV